MKPIFVSVYWRFITSSWRHICRRRQYFSVAKRPPKSLMFTCNVGGNFLPSSASKSPSSRFFKTCFTTPVNSRCISSWNTLLWTVMNTFKIIVHVYLIWSGNRIKIILNNEFVSMNLYSHIIPVHFMIPWEHYYQMLFPGLPAVWSGGTEELIKKAFW